MSPNLVIDAIEHLVKSMPDIGERDRWDMYATIRVLSEDLIRWAEMRGQPPIGLVSEKVLELMTGVAGLAGLSGFHDPEWGLREAMIAVAALRHPNLFGHLQE